MTRWNLLVALLIACALQLGCDEDLDDTTDSDEISELAETTTANLVSIVDLSKTTDADKQIVTFTNLNQYDAPIPDPAETTCYYGFGPTRMPNCTGITDDVDGCTETSRFGDGDCDNEFPDDLNCPATGWDGGDCKNANRDAIEFIVYHDGCDVDAIGGLCHREFVLAGGSASYTPDSIVRSYKDITVVFTYVAEAVQLAVSIALTVVTAGAASGLIAAEAVALASEGAALASEGAVAFAEVAADAAVATAEGAEGAAMAAEDSLNISVATSSAGVAEAETASEGVAEAATKFTTAERFAIRTAVAVPLDTISGGLKGGRQNGFGAALIGGAEAFAASVAASATDGGAKAVFTSMASGKIGSTVAKVALTGIAKMEGYAQRAATAVGKSSARLEKFTSFLWNGGKVVEDTKSAVVKELARGIVDTDSPGLFKAMKNALGLIPKGPAAFKLVSAGTKWALRYEDDNGSRLVEFHHGHLQQIVEDFAKAGGDLKGLTDAFIGQNVPIDRGVRVLAVAHNLWINASELHGQLTPLFENEAEISNFYKNDLPPKLLTAAETLNAWYHLAISATDHTVYAKLNASFAAGNVRADILNALSARDFKADGFAIDATTLKASGYLPMHELATIDAHNVQNLLLFTRMALGMPVPIKLWSDKEWTYLAGYNGKLFRNTAGFLRDPAGAPSFDHWVAPWYPPGNPKHNTYWEEVVSFTDQVGSFASTKKKMEGYIADVPPATQGLYVSDKSHIEMHVSPITDHEEAVGHQACGTTREQLIIVTLEAAEAVNRWKGVTFTTFPYLPTCQVDEAGDWLTRSLEVKADGAPQTVYIPVGNYLDWLETYVANIEEGRSSPGVDTGSVIPSYFNFLEKGSFGIEHAVGATHYTLRDLVGKHITIRWVTEDKGGSDFYSVPKTYDLHGDQTDIVVSTQKVTTSSTSAEIGFKINKGISWWKGIALKKSDGTKLWITKNDLSGSPDSGFTSTAGLSSTDPVTEWGYHVHIEFWKEVTPGVNYYQKSVKILTSQLIGQRTTFEWQYDGTNFGPLKSSYLTDGGHDTIAVETLPMAVIIPGYPEARVYLEAGPGITWWKAVMLRMKDGSKQILEVQNAPEQNGVNISNGSIFIEIVPMMLEGGTEVVIEFWKAKFLGLHTYVGEAKINFDSIDGKNVLFTWENDGILD